MRELNRTSVGHARRATWMEPAAEIEAHTTVAVGCDQPSEIGGHAVRLARVAVAMHMDQAAKLRAMMAGAPPRPFVSTGTSGTTEALP